MKRTNIRYLNSSLTDDYDVFVCSSSFEKRCLVAPQKLYKKHFDKVIIFHNKQGSEKNHQNAEELHRIFGEKAHLLALDYSDPIEIADTMLSEIKRQPSRKKAKILADITTFTHEMLMIFLKIVAVKKNQVTVTCIYTNAEDYCPSCNVAQKWLSRGCEEVHSILGYSGLLFPSQKNRLVIIVGYEHNRAADVISALEPSFLTLVYGTPDNATTDKNKDANKLYLELVKEMSFDFPSIECVEIPCDNPDMTADVLCKLYNTHVDENIIVIPMNNKLSTIGVAKSIMSMDHIQACYAPAVIYNESDYSTPGSSCYIYEL